MEERATRQEEGELCHSGSSHLIKAPQTIMHEIRRNLRLRLTFGGKKVGWSGGHKHVPWHHASQGLGACLLLTGNMILGKLLNNLFKS